MARDAEYAAHLALTTVRSERERVYYLVAYPENDFFRVLIAWGYRGGSLSLRHILDRPVSYAEAMAVVDARLETKLAKNYTLSVRLPSLEEAVAAPFVDNPSPKTLQTVFDALPHCPDWICDCVLDVLSQHLGEPGNYVSLLGTPYRPLMERVFVRFYRAQGSLPRETEGRLAR